MKRDIVMIILSLALGFIAGRGCVKTPPCEPPAVRVDTLTVRDTIVAYKPRVTVLRVVDTMTVPVPVHDTIRRTDSVFVQIPREQLEWSDSLATIWVSGYRPAVDSVQHYTATTVITVTERMPAPRWALGIQAGVGAGRAGLTPYVGVGVSYNLFPLTR